ncbi:hypothetical protein RJ640_029252 [Escallonia rubra]|uniref:Uncharacterized protein n=1 Tax=Escallonia rubra TaxID=112253 RepID=A0AA88QPY5_9ASTE|nr:hypothetical protein RJ640_029252 [Escallonia rubra]
MFGGCLCIANGCSIATARRRTVGKGRREYRRDVGVTELGKQIVDDLFLRMQLLFNRDNSSSILSYVLENRLRKIKVLQGSVTPPACIVWESTVWRAEISGRDYDRTRETPLAIIHTFDLKTSTTSQTIVEQSSTKRGCACTVTLAVEISVPTSSSYII